MDYGLRICFRPILKGVEIEAHDFQTDEDEYYVVNVKDIESTIKAIIGLEEEYNET